MQKTNKEFPFADEFNIWHYTTWMTCNFSELMRVEGLIKQRDKFDFRENYSIHRFTKNFIKKLCTYRNVFFFLLKIFSCIHNLCCSKFSKVIKNFFWHSTFLLLCSRSLKLFMISLLNLCKIKKYFSLNIFFHVYHRYIFCLGFGGGTKGVDMEAIVI